MRPIRPQPRPRIDLPYNVAASRYGTYIATAMEELALSRTAQAKGRPASDFSWSIEYEQASDPATTDQEEFVDHLKTNSKIYLVARGHHWKTQILMTGVTPPQVVAKFEERARLVCGMRRDNDDTEPEVATHKAVTDRDVINLFIDWQKANPSANRRLVTIARVAMDQLFASVKDT